MGRRKKEVEETVPATEPARAEEVAQVEMAAVLPKESPTKSKLWAVYDQNGIYVRSYSVEDHGSDASALAQQFADKIFGSMKAV